MTTTAASPHNMSRASTAAVLLSRLLKRLLRNVLPLLTSQGAPPAGLTFPKLPCCAASGLPLQSGMLEEAPTVPSCKGLPCQQQQHSQPLQLPATAKL